MLMQSAQIGFPLKSMRRSSEPQIAQVGYAFVTIRRSPSVSKDTFVFVSSPSFFLMCFGITMRPSSSTFRSMLNSPQKRFYKYLRRKFRIFPLRINYITQRVELSMGFEAENENRQEIVVFYHLLHYYHANYMPKRRVFFFFDIFTFDAKSKRTAHEPTVYNMRQNICPKYLRKMRKNS